MCTVWECSVLMEAGGDFVAEPLRLHQLAQCLLNTGSCRFLLDCLSLQRFKLQLGVNAPTADSITSLIWLIGSLPFLSSWLILHSEKSFLIYFFFLAARLIQTRNSKLLKEIPLDILPSEIEIIKHTVSLWSKGTSIFFSHVFFWRLTAASSCSD